MVRQVILFGNMGMVALYMVTTSILLSFSNHLVTAQQAEVLFGQSASFSGGAWEPAGRYDAGLLAAFKEVNDVGGVNGRLMRIISYDDQYIVANIKPNFDKLMQIPNLFIFVSFMGSGTVAAAYTLASAAGIPIVAPLTGSAVFRRTFSPYAIHLRSGYDDEALAMLRLFVEQFRFRRIVVMYQNDSFGIPSKDMIIQTLAKLGMSLSGLHVYNRADIPLENFTQRALNVSNQNPQGVIMYTVEGFSNPFFDEFYKLNPTSTVKFITGSWIGDGNTNFFKKRGFNPANLFVTQVTPHPLSKTSATAIKYRKALDAYEGASTQAYDFLSIEGYMTGRLLIEMMKRTREVTRQAFMDAVYGTHMFEIEELLVGPYSNDCNHPQPAVGRSSMCNCTQGLRFVSTTVLNANYGYEVAAPDLTYSMTECYATPDLVSRPAVFVISGSSVPLSLKAGMELIPKISAGLIAVAPNSSSNVLEGNTIRSLGNDTILLGSFSTTPIHEVEEYLVIAGLTSGAVHMDQLQTFRHMTLFIVPTLDQEIYALTSVMTGEVTVILGNTIQPLSLAETIRGLITDSIRTHGDRAHVSYKGFGDSASLSTALSEASSATVFVIGMAGPEYLKAIVANLASTPDRKAHVLFSEVSAAWGAIENSTNVTQSALSRIIVSSNLPHWTRAGKSVFTSQYLSTTAALPPRVRSHPWTVVGYVTARMMDFLMLRALKPDAPNVIDALYKFSVLSVDDENFGPFIYDPDCKDESCISCNVAARTMKYYSLSDIIFGTATTSIPDLRFSSCRIAYKPIQPPEDNTVTIIIAVVVPVGVLIMLFLILLPRFLAYAKIKHAPKDPTKKFSTMFVSLKKESLLWEKYPAGMPVVLDKMSTILDKCIRDHRCFKVKNIGAATMIVARDPHDLVLCAGAAAIALQGTQWYTMLGHAAEEVEIIAKIVRQRGEDGSNTQASSRSSHRSSRSSKVESSMHSGKGGRTTAGGNEVLRVEFGIGLNTDVGRIMVDDRGIYDYSGPSTDGAAIASDYAQGHQVLLTGMFKEADPTIEVLLLVPYTSVRMGTKDVELTQYNPPGLVVRKFEYKEDDQAVDSIAAMLQQQSSGVTSKKATIMTVHCGLVDPAKHTLEEWGEVLKQRSEGIHECVGKGKGAVHAVVGSHIIASFNAVAPTPQSTKRAYQTLIAVSELYDQPVTGSIIVDTAIVGAFKIKSDDGKTVSNFSSVTTKAVDNALYIQGKTTTRYGDAVMAVIPSTLEDEFSTFSMMEYIDIVRLPTTRNVVGLIAVRGMKESGAMDEWMYELEEGDAKDPYRLLNDWFKKILSMKPYTQDLKPLSQDIAAEAEKSKVVMKTNGYKTLIQILEAGSLEGYLTQM